MINSIQARIQLAVEAGYAAARLYRARAYGTLIPPWEERQMLTQALYLTVGTKVLLEDARAVDVYVAEMKKARPEKAKSQVTLPLGFHNFLEIMEATMKSVMAALDDNERYAATRPGKHNKRHLTAI